MEREDLAYIAGLVDGEGYIGIKKRAATRGYRSARHTLTVEVVNTYRPIIQWMQSSFGGSISTKKMSEGANKPAYVWNAGGHQAALKLLQILRPWMRIKATQVWLGLEFSAQSRSYAGCGRGHYLPDEELALREGFYLAMRSANAGY